MIVSKCHVTAVLCTLVSFSIYTYAIIYNKALSTTACSGTPTVCGTATAVSSTPFGSGYEANWAIDGVLTFCNSITNCPGPYLNKMYMS